MIEFLKRCFGVATTTVVSAPLGGVPGAVTAGAEAIRSITDATREANRAATMRAIAAELEKNAKEIDDSIDRAIKKASQNGAALALVALLAIGSLGCASVPPRGSCLSTGNVKRLMARQDFDKAAQAAPEWVRDSLTTANSLESDLQIEKAKSNQVKP